VPIPRYAYARNLGRGEFDQALQKVTEALQAEGFGVLTEIDVKATLKKKLDVDFRRYRILGACNPPLAHSALSQEPLIGLLLPCNVVVCEEEDGSTTVAVINPREMFKTVENPDLAGLAAEVDAKLERVLAAVS